MKVITSPKVRVVGRQVVDEHALDDFLADHDVSGWETDTEVGGEKLSEVAGRVCYMSFAKPRPGGNAAYLAHLKEVGHGSCVEHAVWNLLITGVSRSLTHELIRHRAGFSYSQLSQRYVDESAAEYVCPDVIRDDPELYSLWYKIVGVAHEGYTMLADKLAAKVERVTREHVNGDHPWKCGACFGCGMHVKFVSVGRGRANLDPVDPSKPDSPCPSCGGTGFEKGARTEMRKAARQAARSVLPNATETKIFVTANARALRTFLELRGSRHADPEIRKLAGAVLDVLAKESRNLFSDYTKTPLPDGTYELTTPFPKI